MKAIAFDAPGGAEVLQIHELPAQTPAPGELLIREQAGAARRTETMRRAGARTSDKPGPFVPGMDAAGVIEAINEDTESGLQVGDEVMAFIVPNGSHGAYAERIAVSAESVVRTPDRKSTRLNSS